MKTIKYAFFIVALLALFGCNKDDDSDFQQQYDTDIQLIENYLADNNLTAEKTSTGLYYIITNEGSGSNPNINNVVTVQYSGFLLDGTKFDSGTSSFPLRNVIEGWQQGIPKFKTKGRGKLLIPSYLGYGSSGTSSIPGNSVLIFDIYLISFQ
jgi:FKBP-type peptidyl-prolyl cis-trans isomerase FkpA